MARGRDGEDARTLTPAGRALTLTAVLLLGAGALFGNGAMLAAGALPLLFVAAAAATPPAVTVTRTVATERAQRGEDVRVTLEVATPRRRGLLEVHQPLPDPFALPDETESNFRILRTRRGGDRARTLTFRFTATKRGHWTLAPATVRWVDPLGLVEHAPRVVTETAALEVLPRASHRSIVRDMPAKATRPLPEGDDAIFGLATTEFRELRDYVPGDPMRTVNWKATARRLSTGSGEGLLVNEYEHEGKKSVWILVDGGATLEIGDSVEDAREQAVDSALGLAEKLVRRGYQVGFAAFRAKNTPILLPVNGEAQLNRIRSALLQLAPAEEPSLRGVLDRVAPRLSVTQPLLIVFTRLDPEDDDLSAGLRRARALQGTRPHGPSAVIVDLEPWSVYPDGAGDAFALAERRARHRAAVRRARVAGARVLEWDPWTTPFQALVNQRGVLIR